MHRIARTLAAAVFALVLTAIAGPASAAPWLFTVLDAGSMTGDQVASKVRAETGGRILGVEERQQPDGQTVFVVKVLLPDGVVREVTVSR